MFLRIGIFSVLFCLWQENNARPMGMLGASMHSSMATKMPLLYPFNGSQQPGESPQQEQQKSVVEVSYSDQEEKPPKNDSAAGALEDPSPTGIRLALQMLAENQPDSVILDTAKITQDQLNELKAELIRAAMVTVSKVQDMFRDGISLDDIARELGLSVEEVITISHNLPMGHKE